MEVFGYENNHKLHRIVTTLSSPKNCSIDFTSKPVKNSDFVYSVRHASMKIEKIQVQDWKQSSHLEVWLTLHEGLQASLYIGSFWICCNCFQTTSNIDDKEWTGWDYLWRTSSERIDQSHLRMEALTIELFSNASAELFPDNILSSFADFYRSNWIWKVNGRLHFWKNLTHWCTKMAPSENSCFLVEKIFNFKECYYRDPALYLSFMDIVEAIYTHIQEGHNHSESCITINVSRRMQKVETYLAKEKLGFAFFSTDVGHIFTGKGGNEFRVLLRRNLNLLTSFPE